MSDSIDIENYIPLQSGVGSGVSESVHYSEQAANNTLTGIVHCYWTLKTVKSLHEHFVYTVMPDACVDIVIDVSGAADPIVMTPAMAIESLNLGKSFHYVGIRFQPGALNSDVSIEKIIGNQTSVAHTFLDQIEPTNLELERDQSVQQQYKLLEKYVYKLVESHLAARNTFVENILLGMQYGLSIEEIALRVGYSSRQLQRKVLAQTGYSPIQLRRIIRFQAVLSSGEHELRFADQSHLIKEFKNITGVSYATFARQYSGVRKVQ